MLQAADDINRLLDPQNCRFKRQNRGDRRAATPASSDAVGLRDQRALALTELSEIINIQCGRTGQRFGHGFRRRRLPGVRWHRPRSLGQLYVGIWRSATSTTRWCIEAKPMRALRIYPRAALPGCIASRDDILVNFQNQLDDSRPHAGLTNSTRCTPAARGWWDTNRLVRANSPSPIPKRAARPGRACRTRR